MKIILISGKAEAGKTTTAEILMQWIRSARPNQRAVKIAYGDYVKQTAKQIFGWNGKKDDAGRHLLQWWGTDVVRQKSPNFWIDTVVRLAKVLDGVVDYLLIDDVRFPNEIDCWFDLELAKEFTNRLDVCTMQIVRPEHISNLTPEQLMHPSETALDDYMGFDVTIVAKDLPSLVYELKTEFPRITGITDGVAKELEECDSEICRFAKDGRCTFPLEHRREPRHEEGTGCLDCEIIE